MTEESQPIVQPSSNTKSFNTKKVTVTVVVIAVVLVILGSIGWYVLNQQMTLNPNTINKIATSSTPKKTSTDTPTPTPNPDGSSGTPPKDCGKVTAHVNTTIALDASANQIEDCFWNSYQNKTPATLTLSSLGVDAGSTTYFSITKVNDKSQVTGYNQSYMVPKGAEEKETFSCDSLTKDSNGLHAIKCKFKSSTLDILIPSFH